MVFLDSDSLIPRKNSELGGVVKGRIDDLYFCIVETSKSGAISVPDAKR